MIAGTVWLTVFCWYMVTRIPYPFLGYEIYDVHYLMLLEGRLDVPPRTIRWEGWYTPDGTAFMYNGIAPLLTRFVFGWIWPFETVAMSVPTIWLWTVLGTAGYHSALVGLAQRAQIWESRRTMVLILCAGLWLAGPALLLISNHTFYHEPIAVAYGATGLFIAVWVRMIQGRTPQARAVLWMSILAAIAFHGRPHVAIALYAGTGIAICWGLWRYRATFLVPALLSGLLLGAGVGGYLAVNEARLGAAASVNGSFERTYGFIFFGFESTDSERQEAFADHGRFNAQRILPNLALYVLDVPPRSVFEPVSNAVMSIYRAVTEPALGWIRVGPPRIGMALLWPVWLYLSVIGLWALRRDPPMAALAFCVAMSFGLTLAYGTVTLRYRFDLWPLIGVLALVGAVGTLSAQPSKLRAGILIALLCVGWVCSYVGSDLYSRYFRERIVEHDLWMSWSYEYCADLAEKKGFEGADVTRICREPPSIGGS